MRKAIVASGALLIGLICLLSAAVALLLLLQIPGSSLPFLRSFWLQRDAQSQACPAPRHTVPGTYTANVGQVGGWLVITYSAECAAPGVPPQATSGYLAEDGHGAGCSGAALGQPATPASSASAVFDDVAAGQCGLPGQPNGLTIVTGRVVGTGAATVELGFSGAATLSVPLQGGRFSVTALGATAVCQLHALDAGGARLASYALTGLVPGPLGACP